MRQLAVISNKDDTLPLCHRDHQVAWGDASGLIHDHVFIFHLLVGIFPRKALFYLHLLVNALLASCGEGKTVIRHRVNHSIRIALEFIKKLDQHGGFFVFRGETSNFNCLNCIVGQRYDIIVLFLHAEHGWRSKPDE